MSVWLLFGAGTPEHLGFLPQIFSDSDPRPAKEQAEANYAHGGGWRPQEGWMLSPDLMTANYPGDPPQHALASTSVGDEVLVLFPYGYVAIIQPDGSFEMSRMD